MENYDYDLEQEKFIEWANENNIDSEMKDIILNVMDNFKTPEEWAKNEIKGIKEAIENGEEVEPIYEEELKKVSSWEEVIDLYKRYII